MATRKADVAELIAVSLSLDAHRSGAFSPRDHKGSAAEIWRHLLELARDPDPNVRRWVADAMSEGAPWSRHREVIETLHVLAHDRDGRVRRRAYDAIAIYQRKLKVTV